MTTKYIFPVLNDVDKDLPLYVVTIGEEVHKGYTNRPHGIPHYQIHFTLSGSGMIVLNNKRIVIPPNSMMYLKPYTAQHYYPLENDWKVMWITFARNSSYDILQLDNGIYKMSSIETYANILSEICKIKNTPDFGKNSSAMLYRLLLELKYNVGNYNLFDKSERLKRAVDYINNHYAEPIEVSYLAHICNMSADHFCRVFKRLYKMRPLEYINATRMQEAKNRLVKNPQLPISKIATDVGYNSTSYFIKLFREEENQTPTEFREFHICSSEKKK